MIHYSTARSKSGIALILVLGAIVLLSALVLGFFGRVQSETKSSATYRAGTSARSLADTAVNAVITQVMSGTAGFRSKGGGNREVVAWASQPGAIRNYDTEGNLDKVYKLYSAPQMVTATIDPAEEANALAGWSDHPALFVDLNEPLNSKFPILDPIAFAPDSMPADQKVQGFSNNSPPLAPGDQANPIPMPVSWLYVLKDGNLVVPMDAGSRAVQVSGATADNPIVGRVAFWTDDETAKINLNTAVGGPWKEPSISVSHGNCSYSGTGFSSMFDTPMVYTQQEMAMAVTQPGQREYQRYPGHPATVFLSAALPVLNSLDGLCGFAPRIVNEGSKGGTRIANGTITPDSDRLYSSVEEAIFQARPGVSERSYNLNLTPGQITASKFLLTATSRSPEVNQFNLPRVSMWPLQTDPDRQTPYDKIAAFCTTLGGNSYSFYREEAHDSQHDIELPRNQQLLSYLRRFVSTAVPGFSSSSAGILGKYGNDRDQILTEVFDYIRSTNPQDSSMGINPSRYYSTTGDIVPAHDPGTNTRGFGRFPYLAKAGMLFTCVGRRTSLMNIPPPGEPALGVNQMKMQMILLLEMFTPGMGYLNYQPQARLVVKDLDKLEWAPGIPMFRNNYQQQWDLGGNYAGWHGRQWGGRLSFRGVAFGRSTSTDNNDTSSDYPWVSEFSPALSTSGSFAFSGGTLTVELRTLAKDELLQTYKINFPAGAFPLPAMPPRVVDDKPGSGKLAVTKDFRIAAERLSCAGTAPSATWITGKDVVRSVAVAHGDFRMLAGTDKVPASMFKEHPHYLTSESRAHSFFESASYPFYGGGLGTYVDRTRAPYTRSSNVTASWGAPGEVTKPVKNLNDLSYTGDATRVQQTATNGLSERIYCTDVYTTYGVKAGALATSSSDPRPQGDWDNGVGIVADGPYINRPDDGNARYDNNKVPYFDDSEQQVAPGPNNFTPNRLIPSPGMLGSLPTGVIANSPWQTLLFRPGPAKHPGLSSAKDHLLLDLFTMPVVEPYAISEPLSTAGRINMNYQILPFTWIERSTAVRAALRSEQMLAISNDESMFYKGGNNAPTPAAQMRYPVDIDETIKGFENRFAAKDIFRSASEICTVWLVPKKSATASEPAPTYETMESFWTQHAPTGDNSRERPYTNLYSKLTTKSNSYTVHYRAQSLRKRPSSLVAADVWEEGKDAVEGEFRGSTAIERYIDPNDPEFKDCATRPDATLESLYRFRILSQNQFSP